MGCLFCDKSYKKKYFSQSDSSPYNISYKSSSLITSIPNNIIDIQNKHISTFTIESQYIHDTNLGEGTFGSSIKLIDKFTKKNYVLKILPKELLINLDLNIEVTNTQFFLSNKIYNIEHPNINSIKLIYESDANFFILKDYTAQTLQQKINSNFHFCENDIRNILYQLLSSLEYLHDIGIIHGNVRPENVLMYSNEHIKLDDCGLYEKFLRKSNKHVYLFSPPELIENSKVDKIDEWGVGIIMYLLYCGKYPFNGNSFEEVCRNITKGKYDQTYNEFKNISRKGKNLLFKLLTFNPKYRISVHDALKHPYFNNKHQYNQTYIISTENSFEIISSINETIITNSKQNSYYLTSNSFFDIDNNLNINMMNNNSLSSTYITNYDINVLIKNYFVFIIVFYNENESPDNIFKNYFYKNQILESYYSNVLKLFLVNNYISYDNSETDKNIIDYLSNNKIFLFGSNVTILYEYLKKNEISNVSFKNIIKHIIDIFGKEIEETIILKSLDNYATLNDADINKEMTLNEFHSILNESTLF